ncbi:MAG TPA: hypothetical protein VFV67_19775 [Actinophytocola sp.]|uniref:hypothetical protein n=1 Tax=Actinophytocola sp. TaxID=1872138 RepID=UPI002DB8F4F0|nr:hypothetical protein [Actinophytocola sp.]HEU5472889.1 hypothetical protein [Actinophytocola sp.]
MTQPTQHPHQHYPVAPPVPQNALGTTGFVLGLLGLIFSPIPVIGMVSWPLVILGLVFSFVGVHKVSAGQANNGGLAIAGAVLSSLGLVVCIAWVVAFGSAAS